jgi:ElaB/YqjD/DUF883 family membrane-anchored ribosome-binding protein
MKTATSRGGARAASKRRVSPVRRAVKAAATAYAKDAAAEAADSVRDFVSERPLRSVLIAAGSGVLLGWWCGGTCRS